MTAPLAIHEFRTVEIAREFLKRTRWELRTLRKVRVYTDRLEILDVNGDAFLVRGVGYQDADIIPLLRAVNAAFDPQTIHDPIGQDYKELLTGRRHPWAEDRVM
jgi:hypothetical protein